MTNKNAHVMIEFKNLPVEIQERMLTSRSGREPRDAGCLR